jgi:hypothetical protein
MKTFRITCIKDDRFNLIKRGAVIMTEQIIKTDDSKFRFEVPAGFLIMQIIEILPEQFISKTKKTLPSGS